MNPDISEPHETSSATNAVSLFGQSGGVNDFPVLKAFQEYIDAEQAKARKRMLGLSVFFILLLIVVVITFTLVITSVIARNQQLSDRLLDIALRDKTSAQPVVNVQSPAPTVESAELVRLREELRREKEEIKAEQAKRDEVRFNKLLDAISKPQQQPVAAPTPVVVTTSPSSVLQPAAAETAELARLREELRREKEERQAEQAKAKEEKRKAEIEAHRRRLYPEYYAQEDARRAAAEAAAEPVRPVEPPRRAAPPLPKPNPAPSATQPTQPLPKTTPVPSPAAVQPAPKAKPVPAPVQPPQPQTRAQKLRAMKPVSYFDSSAPAEDPELEELLKKRPAPQAKPPSTPAVNPKPQQPTTAKPAAAARPAVPQPSTKPAPKPTAQPAATPAAQRPAQPEKKTETLAIGGAADGSSIPWLIELPNK